MKTHLISCLFLILFSYSSTIAANCTKPWIRTYDGTCNNLVDTEKGKVGGDFTRLSDEDLLDTSALPNSRLISNKLFEDLNDPGFPNSTPLPVKVPASNGINALFNLFGEILAFDIGAKGRSNEQFLVLFPNDDAFKSFSSIPGIPITGTLYNGTSVNDVGATYGKVVMTTTPWLDGELIYPRDEAVRDHLRTFVGGKLKVRESGLPITYVESGNPVRVNPICAPFQSPNQPEFGTPCLGAPVPVSISYLTLFVREHNRYAEAIAKKYPFLNDEQLFNISRKHVIATFQNIYFNDWLPIIIGKDKAKIVNKKIQFYDPRLDPSASLEYIAALLFGHDTQQLKITGVNANNDTIIDITPLDVIFHPDITDYMESTSIANGEDAVDLFLRGAITNPAMETDLKIDNVIRNIILPGIVLDAFVIPNERNRIDGMSNYHKIREVLGVPVYGVAPGCPVPVDETSEDPIACFNAITPFAGVAQKLKSLYGRLDKMDLLVGGLVEGKGQNAAVGETFARIFMEQSIRLGKSDRHLEIRGLKKYFNQALSLKELIELNTDVQVSGSPFLYND